MLGHVWRALLRRIPWLALLLAGLTGALLKLTGRLALWLLLQVKRHPDLTTAAAASAGLWWLWQRHPISYPISGVALAITFTWSTCWPRSFDAFVGNRLRARVRRFRYRRQWQPACAVTGLAVDTTQGLIPPKLIKVRSYGPHLDVITTEADPPTPDAWRKAAPDVARILGVHTVRVRPDRQGRVSLWTYRTDPLAEPVPPLPTPDTVDLEAIPVGIREDGRLFSLPILYSHLLVAGETGSGKGSCLWSIICGVAPLVRDGLVRLWVIDPKRMEMTAGAPLFDELAVGRDHGPGVPWQTEMAEMLEDAVAGMRERAGQLSGVTRKLTPSREQPLIVIVVDEVAALTAYVTDTKLRNRITDALSLLLSQGRAVGISVVMATQDARKEVLTVRDLVPTRVALRAAEATQADMVLGRDARNRGALTDRISPTTPGVGYVSLEGEPDPIRVRFAWHTDQHIADVARTYAPTTRTETAA